MLISVIIATYNRCTELGDVIESLLCQDSNFDCDFEVIIVDNNSKDRTREIVSSYAVKANKNLRYLFEPRQGKSYALNKGIKASKGEIIAFTDDDVIVAKDWILEIYKEFNRENVDCILGISFWVDETGRIYYVHRPKKDLIIGNGLNMSFKRASLIGEGGFDTDLGPGSIGQSAEDMDIVYRLLKNDKHIIFSEQIKVIHKPRISCVQKEQIFCRDIKGFYFFWLKHALLNRDKYAFKRLYWSLQGLMYSFIKALVARDKAKCREKMLIILSTIIGILKGLGYYSFRLLRRKEHMLACFAERKLDDSSEARN